MVSTALVTGAGYGVGADIAWSLAGRGHDLVLCGRGREDLERVAARVAAEFAVAVRVLPADLTVAEDLERVAAAAGAVDVLVNNAGAGLGVSFDRSSWADEARMLALNVAAPARLVHAALPGMLDRGFGRVLNVCSVAALAPVWQGTSYGASKAFSLALTESLARSGRLRASPVSMTALVLGHTVSRFHELAGIAPSPPWLTMDSAFVAERAVRALHRRRPPVVCVPGFRYRVIAALLGHLPHVLLRSPSVVDDFTVVHAVGDGPSASGGREREDGVVTAEAGGGRQGQG